MKRAIALAFSAAILACIATSPVVAQPGAAGVATYGVGRYSDYSYTPRKQKCRSGMSRWWLSQPVRAYSADQISTTSGGSPGYRSDCTVACKVVSNE
jgi:opacity protein-like surface antigen